MTRVNRSGSHRSRKKRIILILAPVASLAVAVPLMTQAGAATPSEVSADCDSDSDKLEKCEFVDVQVKRNNLGPNERVSAISNGCDLPEGTKTFAVSASVSRLIQKETGVVFEGGASLKGSLIDIGFKFKTQEFNITTDTKSSTLAFSRTDTVLGNHIAFFMWSAKRTDVSGHLKATYKEAQDGQKVFFSPSEGSADVHVFYPQLLNNGSDTPDGRLWLRNVECGTPQADALLNSEGSIRALRTEPGFGKGGAAVTDVEVPLAEVAP